MSITFEGYERRINQIRPVMDKYGIKDFEDAKKICNDKGFDTMGAATVKLDFDEANLEKLKFILDKYKNR